MYICIIFPIREYIDKKNRILTFFLDEIYSKPKPGEL